MATMTTCPRGHAVEADAVYCTVCWIRVEPEDPQRAAALSRRRRRTFLGIPLLIASSVIIGIAVGQVLGNRAAGPEVVALPAPSVSATIPVIPSDAASAAAVAAPLAASVADPVMSASASACLLQLRDQNAPCAIGPDTTTVTVCVPEVTTVLTVEMRPAGSDTWQDVSTQARLDGAGSCPSGSLAAELAIDATGIGSDGAAWRIKALDSAGARVWKSRVLNAA